MTHVDVALTLGPAGAALLRLGCDPQMTARLCAHGTLAGAWGSDDVPTADRMWVIGRAIQAGWSGFDRFCRDVIEPIAAAGPTPHGHEQYARLKVATGARYAIASDIVSWGRIHLGDGWVRGLLLPFGSEDLWASIGLVGADPCADVSPELVWRVIEADARLAVDAMNAAVPP